MKLFAETARFFVTALAVSFAVVMWLNLASLVRGDGFPYDGSVFLLIPAFIFSSLGGLFFGLPAFLFAKALAWDQDRKKMALLGVAIGAFAGIAITIPAYGSTSQFSYPAEILPFWIGMGALAGLVASQIWLTLHEFDDL